ncbi:MAG: hypothetical protein RL766_1718, partial [Bacteroidota bacterium]
MKKCLPLAAFFMLLSFVPARQ